MSSRGISDEAAVGEHDLIARAEAEEQKVGFCPWTITSYTLTNTNAAASQRQHDRSV
jgi:hypothetical protein